MEMASRNLSPKSKKKQNEYVGAYHRRASKTITIRFMKERDKDVLGKLKQVGNVTDYIRQLILKDISE